MCTGSTLACLWLLAVRPCVCSVVFTPSDRWRVVNLQPITYGWAIGELEFYGDAYCSPEWKLGGQAYYNETDPTNTWTPISSGFRDSRRPERAFDGRSWTEWRAQCHICAAEEAYLGIIFEEEWFVKCLRIWQWGEREYATPEIALEFWRDGKWQVSQTYGGIGSSNWNQLSLTPCEPLENPPSGAVEVSNEGYYPSTATYSCGGIHYLGGDEVRECQADGSWGGSEPRCWAPFEIIAIAAAALCLEVLIVILYFLCVIHRKPPKLTATTFLPPERLGSWTTDAMSNFQDEQDMLCCVLCCPICRIADTWHTAGLLSYPIGIFLNQFLVCIPCTGAIFRYLLRNRFAIKGKIVNDCYYWCLCCPCAAAQEAKHVDTMVTIADEEVDVQRRSEQAKKEEEDKKARDPFGIGEDKYERRASSKGDDGSKNRSSSKDSDRRDSSKTSGDRRGSTNERRSSTMSTSERRSSTMSTSDGRRSSTMSQV